MVKNSPIIIKEKSDQGVLRLIMNDSVSKNALSNKMLGSLLDEIKNASVDKSIKVIVLAANGDVFSAGHDLKEIKVARKNADEGKIFFQSLFNLSSNDFLAINYQG